MFLPALFGCLDTVKAKLKYEWEAVQLGVQVQKYHGDNGIFTAQEFQAELEKAEEKMTLTGARAHHQHGISERAIRTVVTKTRVLLLHAML